MGNSQTKTYKTYVEEMKAKRGANIYITRTDRFKNIYLSKKPIKKNQRIYNNINEFTNIKPITRIKKPK